MGGEVVVSPAFRDDPNGWVARMCDKLMAAGVGLTERDANKIKWMRERFCAGLGYIPGPNAYDRLCRLLRVYGLIKRRPIKRGKRETRPVLGARVAVPERFAVGAPIPDPPRLRRPVVMLGTTETWDPAGMPGL